MVVVVWLMLFMADAVAAMVCCAFVFHVFHTANLVITVAAFTAVFAAAFALSHSFVVGVLNITTTAATTTAPATTATTTATTATTTATTTTATATTAATATHSLHLVFLDIARKNPAALLL